MEVFSETARLQKVILHQPMLALRRLTPDNCHDYLFDDVLWVDRAAEEHKEFVETLKGLGVEVFLLHELLYETLSIPAARNWLITKRLAQLYYQSALIDELAHYLNEHDLLELTRYLLGGLTLKESGLKKVTLFTKTMFPHDFLLPPLPNHLFTRDTSFWVGGRVAVAKMAFPARVGESLNMAAIYKFHPLFQPSDDLFWFNGAEDSNLPSIEGGDILVLNKQCLLVGISERTSADGIEYLAKKVFANSSINKIIAVEIPKIRASMHLDTILTMVGEDIFSTAFINHQSVRAWCLEPGMSETRLTISPIGNFFVELANVLGVKELQFINSSGNYFASKREQWGDAANLLVVKPNEVIAYNRNSRMNRKLREAGVIVHEIPSSELSRGRGGPRCMSCPISRGEA